MRGVETLWGNQFNKSVAAFTGRNRVEPLGDRSGGPVVTRTGGLVGALVEVSKLDPNEIAPKDRTSKHVEAYAKAVAGFQKERKIYSGILKEYISAGWTSASIRRPIAS